MARQIVTRREVLNQSAKLFAAHGFRSTSLEAVAAVLGVTRQALYYHFSSKGDILGALFDEMMTKLESAAADADSTHRRAHRAAGEPRFVGLIRAHLTVCVANVDLLALLMRERPEIARIAGLRADKRRRDYTDAFMAAYDEGVAAGELLAVDSWIATNTLLSAANGIHSWYHGSRARRSGARFRDDLTTLLCDGYVIGPRRSMPAL